MATVSGGERLASFMANIRDRIGSAKEVRVGFLEGATYPDGTPVATIAALNNFGAPAAGIPARPFFSDMIAKNSGAWGRALGGIMQAHDFDAAASLELMGAVIADELRVSITDMNAPPNSPVTDLLKQRFPMRDGMTFADVQQARADVAAGASAPAGKPLVWTGTMQSAISSEVE